MKIPTAKRTSKPWYLRDSISFFTGGRFKRVMVTGEAVLAPDLFEPDEIPETVAQPKRRKTRTEAVLPATMFDQTVRSPDDGPKQPMSDEATEERIKCRELTPEEQLQILADDKLFAELAELSTEIDTAAVCTLSSESQIQSD